MILLSIFYKIRIYHQLLFCIVVSPFPPLLLLIKNLSLVMHFCIIDSQWGTLLRSLASIYWLSGIWSKLGILLLLMNISLCSVIVFPLHILFSLRITTLIFVSLCDFFGLVYLYNFSKCHFYCIILLKLFCNIFSNFYFPFILMPLFLDGKPPFLINYIFLSFL